MAINTPNIKIQLRFRINLLVTKAKKKEKLNHL